MTEIDTFINTVESFIKERKITATFFGKKYANDPLFVFQLREGREPRSKTRQKVLEAIAKDKVAA